MTSLVMSRRHGVVKESSAGERYDRLLLAVVIALLVLGMEAVYSSSFAFALVEFGDGNYLIRRQAMWGAIGALLMLVCMWVDYRFWKRWSALIFLGTLAALVALLVPGVGQSYNGASRWLALGPLPSPQPSEFAKLAVIIYLSAWMAGKGEKVRSFWSGLLPFVLVIGAVAGLVMMQPDLGTTVVVVAVAATLFFVGGADLKQFFVLAGVGIAGSIPVILAASYRASRLDAYWNPWQDPQGKGFHIIQALIALGSGGITGLGLGASRQKFFYVPGSHTDAIYAIIGEELGLIGTMVVLLLFAALAYRGFRVVVRAPDQFGALLAVGITCWLLYQAIINIGGITKLIPFTGITLPFISYGGSSLAATMAAAGILLNISKKCRRSWAGEKKLAS